MMAIPDGHILNFRRGSVRTQIPQAVTRRRWRGLLEQASITGGVAHLWSYPHNFLTYPGLIDKSDAILEHARRLVDQGRLVNPTWSDYSRNFGAAHEAG